MLLLLLGYRGGSILPNLRHRPGDRHLSGVELLHECLIPIPDGVEIAADLQTVILVVEHLRDDLDVLDQHLLGIVRYNRRLKEAPKVGSFLLPDERIPGRVRAITIKLNVSHDKKALCKPHDVRVSLIALASEYLIIVEFLVRGLLLLLVDNQVLLSALLAEFVPDRYAHIHEEILEFLSEDPLLDLDFKFYCITKQVHRIHKQVTLEPHVDAFDVDMQVIVWLKALMH